MPHSRSAAWKPVLRSESFRAAALLFHRSLLPWNHENLCLNRVLNLESLFARVRRSWPCHVPSDCDRQPRASTGCASVWGVCVRGMCVCGMCVCGVCVCGMRVRMSAFRRSSAVCGLHTHSVRTQRPLPMPSESSPSPLRFLSESRASRSTLRVLSSESSPSPPACVACNSAAPLHGPRPANRLRLACGACHSASECI
jgi:hypothetical protein